MIIFTTALAFVIGAFSAIARKSSKTKVKQSTKTPLSDEELVTVILPTVKSLD